MTAIDTSHPQSWSHVTMTLAMSPIARYPSRHRFRGRGLNNKLGNEVIAWT